MFELVNNKKDLNKSSEEILLEANNVVNEGNILSDSGDYVFIDNFEVKIASIKETLALKNLVVDIIKSNHKSQYDAFILFDWIKSTVSKTKVVKRKGVEETVLKKESEYNSQIIALLLKHKVDKSLVEEYYMLYNYYNKIVFVNRYLKGFQGLSIDETIEKLNRENDDKGLLVENVVNNLVELAENIEKLEEKDNDKKNDLLNKSTGINKKAEVDDFREE